MYGNVTIKYRQISDLDIVEVEFSVDLSHLFQVFHLSCAFVALANQLHKRKHTINLLHIIHTHFHLTFCKACKQVMTSLQSGASGFMRCATASTRRGSRVIRCIGSARNDDSVKPWNDFDASLFAKNTENCRFSRLEKQLGQSSVSGPYKFRNFF